jgi:hypothetical protein
MGIENHRPFVFTCRNMQSIPLDANESCRYAEGHLTFMQLGKPQSTSIHLNPELDLECKCLIHALRANTITVLHSLTAWI